MPHPRMFDEDDPVLGRLRSCALALPDAAEKVSHGQPAFFTTKVFAYYGGAEKHADGSYARYDASVLVLTDPAERPALLQQARTYLPMYLAPSGWIGVRLGARTDWDEIAELVETSYRRTAGVRRVRALDASQSSSAS